jgi:nucleoside-diphosphate-sugar epimerase
MSRVLVTGARGFIGRQCVAALTQRGADVHAVTSAHGASVADGVSWHRADLRSSADAARLVDAVRPERILHLAWITTPGEYWHSAENLQWLEGSVALLRAAAVHGVTRFVGAGTCAEYDWSQPLLAEGDRAAPATLYGTCKHALHSCLGAFAPGVGMSHAWGRIFFLYGPGEHPARLVPGVANALLRGQPAECTSGEQLRDFMHVADVADAFVELLFSDVEGPVNIASGEPHSVREVVEVIAALTGRADLVRFGARPQPAGEPAALLADVSRLNGAVGWRPRHGLADGLAETVEWWRSRIHA